MSWWQTMASTTSPAVVTAAALLWQASRSGRREQAKTRAEASERASLREHELQLAQARRSLELARLWSDGRRAGHTELLASCAEAIDTLELQIDPYFGNDFDLPTAGLPDELVRTMRSEVAHIELMSNDETQAAARAAFGQLEHVSELSIGIYACKEVEGDVSLDEVEHAMSELGEAKEQVHKYRTVARAELGTNG